MSEVSRLGREQIETAYAPKQLSVAGVRCFSYLEDREVLLESATDEFLLGAVTFAADLERKKAQQRTYDAMARKAKAGHVCGGKTFGYDNIDVRDASGQRSHVERRINHIEAAAIRRIFQLSAEGYGLRSWPSGSTRRAPVPAGPTRALAILGAEVCSGSSPSRTVSRADRVGANSQARQVGQEATGRPAGVRLDSPARACTPHRQR
jgi:hypothetical protein